MLHNKVALITHVTEPFANAVARRFAYEKAHVVLVGDDVNVLEKLESDIHFLGGKSTIMTVDLSNLEVIEIISSTIKSKFDRLDIFVGGPGNLRSLELLTDIKEKEWANIITVGLHTNLRLLKSLDKLLKRADHGRVVFGISGDLRDTLWGSYAMVNDALKRLITCYALENEHSDRMRVNLVDMKSNQLYCQSNTCKVESERLSEMFLRLSLESIQETGNIYQSVI